ncbi:SDR family oxidoreductase [Rhodopila sp.]|uniref:SDR family oxidoreductase n=1 Tax=Rhodopila sp. TaxID=2480087 RepID=UPI003D128F80
MSAGSSLATDAATDAALLAVGCVTAADVPTRSVIITGGSSGIGRCTAVLFARHGWRVGLIARGEAGLAAAAADVRAAGARAAVAVADVTLSAALRAAADAIVAELGPPVVWINCAGNGVYGRFSSVSEAQFDQVTAVTYGGTVNGCRVALALMAPLGRGTIVNVCSAVAFHGLPLMTSYAGAKSAVRGFAQALRAELRIERSPIRVSTIFPPAVNTPFFSHAVSHMGWPARPVPPVYQPEIVAAGIHLAVSLGRAEMVISGTAAAFSLAARVSPALVAYLMTRLGLDGHVTRDPEASRLQQPTLFAASEDASPIHGPFGRHARRRSVQLWLWRAGSAGAKLGRLARAAGRRVRVRPASR